MEGFHLDGAGRLDPFGGEFEVPGIEVAEDDGSVFARGRRQKRGMPTSAGSTVEHHVSRGDVEAGDDFQRHDRRVAGIRRWIGGGGHEFIVAGRFRACSPASARGSASGELGPWIRMDPATPEIDECGILRAVVIEPTGGDADEVDHDPVDARAADHAADVQDRLVGPDHPTRPTDSEEPGTHREPGHHVGPGPTDPRDDRGEEQQVHDAGGVEEDLVQGA